MMTLLETRQLGRVFRRSARGEVCAVTDVSLSIEEGSLTVLVGPSGSGKTTLLSLIGALDRPTSGQVFFEGRDLSNCSDAELARVRRRIGFVFQDFALLPRLSVLDCITYPLIPCGVDRRVRLERANELLDKLDIVHCRNALCRELSAGERQRVAFARALVAEPRLLLADEPTSNLDAESEERVVEILKELHAARTTIVLATHDPRCLALATNVVELQSGRVTNSNTLEPR